MDACSCVSSVAHGQPVVIVLPIQLGVGLRILAVNPVEADVYLIRKACKGAGTDKELLYSIVLGRTNKEMEIIKVRFEWIVDAQVSTVCCLTVAIFTLSFV